MSNQSRITHKRKMTVIIYKITNLTNGKIYIGLTTRTLEKRWKDHRRSYKQTGFAIHNSMLKYGIENFTIEQIDSADNIDDLITLESEYIKKFNSMNPNFGYNMMYQNDSIKFINEDIRKKIGDSNRKRINSLTPEKRKEIVEKQNLGKQGTKKSSGKTSKYIGVVKEKRCNTYAFHISKNGVRIRGNCKTEEEAAKAYDEAALKLYGENAKLNFPK